MSRTTFLVDLDDPALAELVADRLDGRAEVLDDIGPDSTLVAVAAATRPVLVVGRRGDHPGAVVQPVRWWLRAARATGAFVVLASGADVFGAPDGADDGANRPDEWATPAPDDAAGRMLRAAEGLLGGLESAIVRGDDDRAAFSELLVWAATGRHHGRWHVDSDRLDGRFTELVRLETSVAGHGRYG